MKQSKKDNFYYLMQDLLSCFPNKFENNFLNIINHHLIAKAATRQIFREEVKKQKPKFNTLMGCLILQNAFLAQMSQVAFYEVIEVCRELDYCFRYDKRKNINKISSDVILRLFITLYLELVMLSLRKEEGKDFINEFKKFFSRKDILLIVNKNPYHARFIMERQGIDIGYGDEMNEKFKKFLDEFYLAEDLL